VVLLSGGVHSTTAAALTRDGLALYARTLACGRYGAENLWALPMAGQT
jgi:hypothetical protein